MLIVEPVIVRALSEAAKAATLPTSSNVAARSQHRRGDDPLDDGVASFGVLGDGIEHAAALQGHGADAVGSELASQHVAAPPLPRRAYLTCQTLIKPFGLNTNFLAAPWSKSL